MIGSPNTYWTVWAIATGLDWDERPLNPENFEPNDELIRKWKEYNAAKAEGRE